jgi:5-methylcytosine-specific restriction protein A
LKPQRRCNSSTCRTLINYDIKYCTKHEKKEGEEYNKYIRNNKDNKKYTDFYNSKEWRALRKIFKIENPLCVYCLEEGTIKETEIIHHKKEIREDFNKRLNKDNLESVCRNHHNKIHKI